MTKRILQGAGSPSICWHCGKQLQRAKGIGKGLFYFQLVIDPVDTVHRVHGHCYKAVLGDGIKPFSDRVAQ